MKRIYRRMILLMMALCMLLPAAAAAEQDPATPTDLDPTPQGLIEEEIRKADKTVKLENEVRITGQLKAEEGGYVYRIAVEAKKGSKICIFAESDRQVEVHAAPADGSAEQNLKETRKEGEDAGYSYEVISYDTRTDITLIRIIGKSPAPFTVLIQTEAAWKASQPTNPPTDPPTNPPTDPPTNPPTEQPTEQPDVTPTPEPTPTPTPAPTPTPEPQEPEHKPDPTTPTPEPEPDPDPEPDPGPIHWGGGGGGGRAQPHAKNTAAPKADYDLILLSGLDKTGETRMSRLSLGGEELELELRQTGTENAGFTVSAIRWEQAEGEETGAGAPDTLVLTAENAEHNTWEINGTVLRRMNKSGIAHLALRTGERLVVISTDGILEGWAYDELKSRGTGSRRFTFTIETGGDNPAVWQLDVDGTTYMLTEDTQAEIHLTNVYDGPAEALESPFGSWEDKTKESEDVSR